MRKKKLIAAMALGLMCLYATGESMAAEAAKEKSPAGEEQGVLTKVKEHVTVKGAIEVEVSWSEDYAGVSESDIALATAEFGFEGKMTDWVVGTLALEWLDDEDKIDVDEAFVTLGNTEKFPLTLQAGRYVVPFGAFASNTLSDPLTLEAFETKEDAVMVAVEAAGLRAGVYAFNGDTNEGEGDDTIEHFGAHLGYSLEKEPFSLEVGMGYLSSVVDSDFLSENLDLSAEYVGAVAVNARVAIAGISFSGEYMSAIDDYQAGDLEIAESQPSAYHLEAGYEVEVSEFPLIFALSYSATSDFGGLLPENRVAAMAGIELTEGLRFSLEYTHDTDYEIDEGGTAEEADAVTTQLAYEF